MNYTIEISPQPAPRPRAGKKQSFNPANYTAYKEELKRKLSLLDIPKEDYRGITATFYISYDIMTEDSKRLSTFHIKTPDWDNLSKPLLDAMQQAGIIKNDSRIAFATISKVMTPKLRGSIEFTLHSEEEAKSILNLLGIDALKD